MQKVTEVPCLGQVCQVSVTCSRQGTENGFVGCRRCEVTEVVFGRAVMQASSVFNALGIP